MMLRVPVVDGKERYSLGTVEAHNKLAGIPTRSFTIPCRRLDTFDLSNVGVIKIDVEGHELAVLEGAQTLLLKDHPSLMIEAEERHRPGTVREISSYLANFGYLGFFLVGRRLRPIAEFDVARYQNAGSISLSEVLPGYVYANNFVFVKSIESVSQLLNRTL